MWGWGWGSAIRLDRGSGARCNRSDRRWNGAVQAIFCFGTISSARASDSAKASGPVISIAREVIPSNHFRSVQVARFDESR